MIQDYFINSVIVTKRVWEQDTYEDWISKKKYLDETTTITCRISSLNYRDLQLISDIDDVQRVVKKMYTLPNVDISPKDLITWEWKSYTVIAKYKPQDKSSVHHNKYFIKLVE